MEDGSIEQIKIDIKSFYNFFDTKTKKRKNNPINRIRILEKEYLNEMDKRTGTYKPPTQYLLALQQFILK